MITYTSVKNYKRKIQEEKPLPLTKTLIRYILLTGLMVLMVTSRHLIKSTKYEGLVLKNEEIMVVVPVRDLKWFDELTKLKINGRRYRYEVERMEKEIISEGTQFYKKVILKIPTYKNTKLENLVFEFWLEGKTKTILEIIRDFGKGE